MTPGATDAGSMMNGNDALLTERDLSIFLGLSLPTLQRMRAHGTGPCFVRLSERRIAYRRGDVESWLASRTTDRIGAVNVQRGGVPASNIGKAA